MPADLLRRDLRAVPRALATPRLGNGRLHCFLPMIPDRTKRFLEPYCVIEIAEIVKT
jgi:hypothetical protein